MNSKKVFFIMIGAVVLTGGLMIATIVLGDIFLGKQSDRLLSLKLDDQVLDAQQVSLGQAKKDLEKYSELEAVAKQIVPQDKDQARATREIIQLADQAGIKISTISFPASTLGQAPAKTVAPSGDESASTTPKVTTPSITQVKPVDGIKNLYQLEITVASDTTKPSTYTRLIDFLTRLEKNRRTAQVTQISIQPDPKNRSGLNFNLTITLYLKP